MKHTVTTTQSLHIISFTLESLFRNYMESFTDVAWDTSGEMMAETVHKDILSGDYEKLRALFKDGMSNMMLSGDIMNLVELFNGWISGKSEKGPFEPFILMITNIPGKNNPLIISGEDVNY